MRAIWTAAEAIAYYDRLKELGASSWIWSQHADVLAGLSIDYPIGDPTGMELRFRAIQARQQSRDAYRKEHGYA